MIDEEQRKKSMVPQEFSDYEFGLARQRYLYGLGKQGNFIKDKIVLDAGCGYGVGTHELLVFDPKKIIGVDGYKPALEAANKYFFSPNIEYVNARLHETGQKDIDVIIFVETIEHVDYEERDLILNHFYNILNEDGLLYITTPRLRGKKEDFPKGSHVIEYEYDELVSILKSHGFELVAGEANAIDISMMILVKKVTE